MTCQRALSHGPRPIRSAADRRVRQSTFWVGLFVLAVFAPSSLAADWCDEPKHDPAQPTSGKPVVVTTAVADGVLDVRLLYQVVEPGQYIEPKDPEYASKWTPLPMQAGAIKDGRTTYTATVPADVQKHRRLVRYRIAAQSTAGGKELIVPESDPRTPGANYAWFVYDGIPEWKGALKPTSSSAERRQPMTFPADVMRSVQAYHLIGKKQSIENATWHERSGGGEYKYTGTLVVDGIVYDHVGYRARGGVWRYALGKNQWKFDLNNDQRLAARDDFGQPYPVTWGKLNLRGIIQLGSYGRRGEQGLYESVGFRLFNLAGVPAPYTHYIQLRVINTAEESPANQFEGDFWGLYLAIENEDGRFLKTHDLPDGNFYKMEGGTGTLESQGKKQPADGSDLKAFLNAYNSKDQPEEWWRKNLNLPSYYSYRAIVECIHHYDIAEGKNYNYFNNPKTGQWQVIPWDLDLTWADHMYGSGDEPFNRRVLSKPVFQREYQNRLREIRDLLFNPEQTHQLIDEYAAIIGGGAAGATIAEADRRKWDWHPALTVSGEAGQGRYYQGADPKDFSGMIRQMKAYVDTRGKWIDKELLKETDLPATPTLRYAGPAGFSAAALAFQTDAYKGKDPFAAMQWRVAEITPAAEKVARPARRQYEITPVWQSDELTTFTDKVTVPPGVVQPGKTYRARVKMKDSAGRWSHWSAPVEFKAGA